MNNKTQTLWTSYKMASYKPLIKDLKSKVAIVGGGMVGAMSAYLLVEEGVEVALFEEEEVGQGVTSLTTAFLTEIIDTDACDLITMFGVEKAREIIESHKRAIDEIERIVRKHAMDCDFMRTSNIIYANTRDDFSKLLEEANCLRRLGVDVLVVKNRNELPFENQGYMEVRNQAKFHPLKFIDKILQEAQGMGAQIFEQTKVSSVSPNLIANSYNVEAQWIVSATH